MNDNKYLDILLYVFIDRVDRTVDAIVGGGRAEGWRWWWRGKLAVTVTGATA